jgi:hypothetical protein
MDGLSLAEKHAPQHVRCPLTKQIERFKRILNLMPSADAMPFEDCTCTSYGDPSPWFHQAHCPVCIEFWQHQSAASHAVDEAMQQEQEAPLSLEQP